MLDNRKYRSYTNPNEWHPFFAAMAHIVKQIYKKTGRLEKDSETYKQKYERTFAEKDELF
jgi:hypothetical protein